MGSHRPRRFYLMTYPRTASNLLVRILGLDEQPNVLPGHTRGGYFFLPVIQLMGALQLRNRGVAEWTDEERRQVKQCYQDCFDTLQEYLDEADSKRCSIFVKEHIHFLAEPTVLTRQLCGTSVEEAPWMVNVPEVYGFTRSAQNETVVPDGFLRTWLPTFLIRHPALAFPSRYRVFLDVNGVHPDGVGGEQGTLTMTLRWTRSLYNWYRDNLTAEESYIDGDVTWPVVIDADDVMANQAVVMRYCDILGMDRSKLRFSWQPWTEEQKAEMDKYPRRFLSTLIASSGIVKGKTSDEVDVDVEAKKWREEFGENAAAEIEQLVRAAMPDYEFLRARRLGATKP
ncbi:hypothetical protein BDV28DRAFT_160444 [Aspergillus coremiiformis]|uniref:P-loop containing nucleoside triphosphate hydrolase protein n=1 Tax=Aspergillus coremiiformis TaxID=138285 RepID=A0A5N6YXV3_9EURO|nr:hypothetical protein BDV28DRAFT_160444 [Aspergillus coremiiformis]